MPLVLPVLFLCQSPTSFPNKGFRALGKIFPRTFFRASAIFSDYILNRDHKDLPFEVNTP